MLEHSFSVKSWGWGGVVADVIIVSGPVKRFGHLDFLDLVWTKGLTFGPVRTGDWDMDLGLTIYCPACSTCDSMPAGNLAFHA